MPDPARVFTCRDLYRLGLTDFADHDPRAIRDGGCFCYLDEVPGQLLYEEAQACRAIHTIEGDGFRLELCCGCGDSWPGTDEELLEIVAEILRESAAEYCVVEVIEDASGEAHYAACEEERRARQVIADQFRGSVRIVLPHLSRSTAERVAGRMTRVRQSEERKARCG